MLVNVDHSILVRLHDESTPEGNVMSSTQRLLEAIYLLLLFVHLVMLLNKYINTFSSIVHCLSGLNIKKERKSTSKNTFDLRLEKWVNISTPLHEPTDFVWFHLTHL